MKTGLEDKDTKELVIILHTKMDVLLDLSKDHEKRIRALEKAGYIYKGALTLLIFLSGFIEPFIVWKKK